jgi:hypothetical protein
MKRIDGPWGADLAQVLNEDGLGWRRAFPLLAGVGAFLVTAPWLREHPAWALSLGLWLGHAVTDGLSGWLGRRLTGGRELGLPLLLFLGLLLGATLGWATEMALTTAVLKAGDRLTRLWLHVGFGAALIGVPLLQGLRRVRALRRVEQERALLRAELMLLQAQIEPHFLFNTLATLRSFVRQGSERALPLLDAITGLLESTLERLRQHEHSTLGEECQMVQHYLAIMALRLGDRLAYRLDVDATLHGVRLPPLMLQPLVENAIRHGIECSEAGGTVHLDATVSEGRVRLSVTNSGGPLAATSASGHGMAVMNLRQRLEALYGGRASLTLATNAAGLTEATLLLPQT